MAYIKLQLCIILLQLFVFVNSEGKNCISTLLLTSRFIHYLLYYLSYNKFIVPTTGCDVISSEGTCYSYFTSTGINWADSRLQCVSRGSDLATIKSSEDNTLLYNLTTSGLFCWIGLHDQNTENTFVWADGSDSSYRNWDVGEPNNVGGTQDCTWMWGGGYWDDDHCIESKSCYYCGTEGKHFEYCMCMLCIMLVPCYQVT